MKREQKNSNREDGKRSLNVKFFQNDKFVAHAAMIILEIKKPTTGKYETESKLSLQTFE